MCRTFPGYRTFLGCNYTSAFCTKGEVRPCKILENNLKFQEVFGRIGLRGKINEDDSTENEKYVFTIYDRKRLASVDEILFELFLKKYQPKEINLISNMKKIDGSQSPPCSRVLKEKIKRTKYITGVWLSSVFLSPPDRSALDYGWIMQHQMD